jgi:fumarate reductase subunit D
MQFMRIAFILIFYLLCIHNLIASVTVHRDKVCYITVSDYRMLNNAGGKISLEEVQLLPDSAFRFDPALFNKVKNPYLWLRLELYVEPAAEGKWLLEFFNQRANEVRVYVKNPTGALVASDTIGSSIPFYHRAVHSRFPVFEVPLEAGANTLYLYYHSDHHLGLNTVIQPYVHYINYANKYYFIIGGFYFMLLLLIFYNALFFFSTHDKIYLYYIFFVIAAAIDCLRVDQLGFAIFWSGTPWLNYYIDEYARVVFIAALVNYTTYFLELKKDRKKLYIAVWLVLVAFALQQIVFSEFFPAFSASLQVSELLIFTILVLIMYGALRRLKEGIRAIRIFMVGFSSIFIGFLVTYLFYNGLIPGNHLVYFILFYGIAVDTLMFSFALSARLKKERMDKEKALEAENVANQKVILEMHKNEQLLNKVNTELEEKVQARTEALEQANRRLEEQATIINEWNASLDRKNWELNKEIKAVTVKSVLSPNQNYAEMLAVFPGKDTCYQYVAGLKWKDGFVCRKCGNAKANEGDTFLSKRCTKCGIIESVTAHTVFHKLKFPIEKAFYIAYVVFSSKESPNMSELAKEIDLNYKSCIRFRQKIEEAIEERKKQGIKVKNWEDIILDS